MRGNENKGGEMGVKFKFNVWVAIEFYVQKKLLFFFKLKRTASGG